MLKRILLYAAYVLTIIVLIVAIIAAFHSDKSTKSTPKKVANAGKTQVQKATSKTGGSVDITKPQTSSPSGSSGSVASSKSTTLPGDTGPATPTSTGTAATPRNLNNSGPGDVVALFIGSIIAGSIGFSLYQRKKLV